jgi:PAS domain S-box-containing protein
MDQLNTLLLKLRMRLRPTSVKTKVIIGVSLTLILAIGLFTYLDMVSRVKFHLEAQEERAYEISDTVMRSIEYPMLDGEMEKLQAILESLITLKDIAVVHLCDTAGVIRYSGLPDNIGNVTKSEVTKQALLTSSRLKGLEMKGEKKILRHAMPIPNEETCYKCHGSEKKILGVLTVGINWSPIEERIAALRNREITLGIGSVIVVGFLLTLFLSRYITLPLGTLTRLADEISRGNPGFKFGRLLKCWDVMKCDKTECPAYGKPEIMCWYINGTLCQVQPSGSFPKKLDMCRQCIVYRTHVGDEMVQLADSLKHMVHTLRTFEKELRRSEEKYKTLFDTDPNPIFILDCKALRILDANARSENQYGYSKEELLEMSFVDLGEEETASKIISSFKDISHGACIFLPKMQHRIKDGGLFYVNIHVCSARYEGQDVFIAATTDISESIQKEAQLIHAAKLTTLGEMATGVAHELNQPLTTIQLSSDVIKNMIKAGEEIPRDLLALISEQMAEQISRAVGIINHLREFGRKDEFESERVDVNKPLRGVFTLLGQQLKVRGINVILDLKDELPSIRADSNKLEQVFIDLVLNARDAMEEKEEKSAGEKFERIIAIRSFQENNSVIVTISDTGTGIPQEMSAKIFEPFFTTKKVGKGTGLGLSIGYGIIKEYQGIIEVESEMGKGTTFKMIFPACEENQRGVQSYAEGNGG